MYEPVKDPEILMNRFMMGKRKLIWMGEELPSDVVDGMIEAGLLVGNRLPEGVSFDCVRCRFRYRGKRYRELLEIS